jgi:hypothetical protein
VFRQIAKVAGMPRFGTKSLLVGVSLIAAWLSTLSGYAAGQDVRRAVLLVIVSAAGFSAIYFRGQRQAFWIGFSFALVLLAIQPQWRFVPSTWWSRQLAENLAVQTPIGPVAPNTTPAHEGPVVGRQLKVFHGIIDTVWLVCAMLLSAVIGWIGTTIHDLAGRPVAD